MLHVTLDASKLAAKPLRFGFGDYNSAYSTYYPDRQTLVGLRARFRWHDDESLLPNVEWLGMFDSFSRPPFLPAWHWLPLVDSATHR